ncbi:hypothetical protein GKD24_08265 [Lactobacillus paracasei]|uniref:Uncharacterized protein n=6 Tax=Lacticaseibacillus paracasei TaxID=1597 RepID=Q038G6_LACP3|nr:hypothetical protein [Lacticaseibacillus paracasei]ABJ70406.1 hypothetical protein LSEI_1632 [Lacticaseibacillus paracasei ATCC 334]AHJ32697.1 hypothetical protein AF91_05730 [Lacticaseibacillus paracasei N1115]AZP99053.1 hypothetical protein CYL78_09530 [Lacticaseibacillus paracasei subsp. tolerans]EEI67694.1 hypothetical protein HMPREF0530_2157 [Lacticaseibacillus paracasei subsp. paracasei ATCC 25302 = DSM 5622 = JCM 8130]EKP99575.1 hypothetical protein LCA12A_1250 [Lacticaseibacillus ca
MPFMQAQKFGFDDQQPAMNGMMVARDTAQPANTDHLNRLM